MCPLSSSLRSLSKAALALLAAGLLAAPRTAAADITYEQVIKSGGILGMGATETRSTTYLAGDRQKTVSTTKFTGKVLGFMTGGKPTEKVSIVRLDKEVMWDLDPPKKKYTEMTFAELRAMLEKVSAEAKKGRKEGKPPTVTVDIKRTGQKKDIAGYPCEQAILTMRTELQDEESGQKATTTLTSDMWLTTAIPGADEQVAFARAMAEKIGLSYDLQQSFGGIFEAMGFDLAQYTEKAGEVHGFPMMQTITIQGEAPEQGAGAEGQEGAEEQAKGEGEEQPAPPRGLGDLGKILGRGGEEKPSSGESAPKATVTITTEVMAVRPGAVPAAEFEIPAGYTKASR